MIDDSGLNIQRKKGEPGKLQGKLIAYATLDKDVHASEGAMQSMVRNGILAVQANYVDQRNIRDFFQAEFGVSLEKGIEEIIEQAKESGGLEGALDPNVVRDKLESMRNMEFIPIPAKITFFQSEEEIMEQTEDIYYLGHFKIVSHAHLCVNSFPILYQAKFREQEHLAVTREIQEMLQNLEQTTGTTQGKNPAARPRKGQEVQETIQHFKGDIKSHLLKKLIPDMLYNLGNKAAYSIAESQFKGFMSGYGYPHDTEAILSLVNSNLKDDKRKLARLELLVEKIEALLQENYSKLDIIKKKMKELE